MATIDDYGDTSEPLNNPPLGGPSGWAKAVRDYLAVTVPGLFVAKTGATMTGPLVIEQDDGTAAGARLKVDSGGSGIGTVRYAGPTSGFIFDIDGGSGATSERPVVAGGYPTAATHFATKSYVDANYNANGVNSTTDLNTLEDPGLQPNLYGTGNPNTPESGKYFMVLNIVYNNTEITQFAIPYANVAGSANVYMRGRYQGGWSAWQAWK